MNSYKLDCRGQHCPMPIVNLAKRVKEMGIGDEMHIPRDPGHPFHAMPDSIPRDLGHRYTRCRTPFQLMPDVFGPVRGIG